MRTRLLCLALLVTGCAEQTFSADFEGSTSDPTLWLDTEVHQFFKDGQPSTMFRVWVARAEVIDSFPPAAEDIVSDAEVEIGIDQETVVAPFAADASGGHYEVIVAQWVDNVHVIARHAGATAEITRAEPISDPTQMRPSVSEPIYVGAPAELHWVAQGRPVRPLVSVSTASEPIEFRWVSYPFAAETGSIVLPGAAFDRVGDYGINLIRRVDHHQSAGDEPENLRLTSLSYWTTRVTALPPPIL